MFTEVIVCWREIKHIAALKNNSTVRIIILIYSLCQTLVGIKLSYLFIHHS